MLDSTQPENVLFLDIETVPAYAEYSLLPEMLCRLWNVKAGHIKKSDKETPESIYDRAGIYAEFGKIICISCALIRSTSVPLPPDLKCGTGPNGGEAGISPQIGSRGARGGSRGDDREIRIKSFFGDDEKVLLENFSALLNKSFSRDHHRLCAHNGKEFDFPYLARRILINGLPLPKILDLAGKKPWEVHHFDTLELWKFGDNKHYTSLELLASNFNIPTPKDDISGKDIARVYWKEHDLPRITDYCQKDVLTVAQLFLKFKGEQLIEEENVLIV